MDTVYHVKKEWADKALITEELYKEWYEKSISDPDGFWGEHATCIEWYKKWDKVLEWDFNKGYHSWFMGGSTNVCYNCVDRHLEKRGDQTAIIWEGDSPDESSKITYKELHKLVCKCANMLKANNIKKGDRVTLYLPMIPELAIAMLACARIGAIHTVVFGGFSADALKNRLLDSKSEFVITADEGLRGSKSVPLKANVDEAVKGTGVKTIINVKRTGGTITFNKGVDRWWHEEMAKTDSECPCEEMDAEDPLFILYTSGSTGKPKGVLHTTGGYLVYVAHSFKYIFNYHDGDIYWCTADIGWITGHSYIVYGPLANGAVTLMFEGVPSYPSYSRFWEVCDKHKVNIFYTAPTAIRAIMREGDDFVKQTDRKSLKLLGSVGEPINPEVWEWYYKVVGEERCPVVDTWWQTETGGILITPLPGATPLKPGSAARPYFGIKPELIDNDRKKLDGASSGNLCIKQPWPGLMRKVYGDPDRFYSTYFIQYPGYYFTGDGAKRDEDGYFWITGRVDDIINVSGHRMGTAEVESALVSHLKVAEAAVVGFPHDLKGQGIYAYITLNANEEPSKDLIQELKNWVRKEIGPIATPDIIHFAPQLPKTRSGKIMRRILRKIAANDVDDFGDTSTLAEPGVVDTLVSNRPLK